MKIKKGILSGAIILGAGAFVAKLLGALYRVPLTNLIGGYGLGLYQMVFPVYGALLDFSGAGAPNAVSKIVSSFPKEDRKINAEKVLFVSKRLFSILGLIASLVMATFSGIIARAQGDESAFYAYLTLAPAVFFVCLISCYRGYFQGFMNMTPTAVSQIVEQVVKITLGLIFVKGLLSNIPKAVAGATLAITISEIVALIYLVISHRRTKPFKDFLPLKKGELKSIGISVIKYALPLTLVGIIIPLSQIADSFIIINTLKKRAVNGTLIFGLFSGVALTIMNLPVSICYGVATASVPAISGEEDREKRKKKAKKSILLTLLFSIPCAIFCFVFSNFIIGVLFKNLAVNEKAISSTLLKILSLGIILLSLLQTQNAVLIGAGRKYFPVISLGVGVIVKIFLEIILLKTLSLYIYAGAIALIACYFIANLLNFIWIKKVGL